MGQPAAFNMITVDACHEGADGSFDFWNLDNTEFERFSIDQLDRADRLVFGRSTCEGMAAYWPSEEARHGSPRVAERMNDTPRVLVSRTMTSTYWQPTTIVDDISRLADQEDDSLVLTERLHLQLRDVHAFDSGNVLLTCGRRP